MIDAGAERLDLDRIADNSHVLTSLRQIATPLTTVTQWLRHATKNSFLYRWLTREPEPEVIVIDLRDTYTVGPVIAVVERLVAMLAPGWRSSTLRRVAGRVAMVAGSAARTRMGRAVTKLLEPPEPPEDER